MAQWFLYSSFNKNEPTPEFRGFAYNSSSLILDKVGFEAFLSKYGYEATKNLQGQFYSLLKQQDSFYLFTDILGSEPIFYYSSLDSWAFSNSLYHLTEHLASYGQRLSLNNDVAEYFGLKYSLCEQLVGPGTFVQQISMLMPGEVLKVSSSASGHTPALSVIKPSEVFQREFDSYPDAIVQGVKEVGNVLLTLEGLYPGAMSIDLTGGVDSRVVYGIAKRSLRDFSSLHISSAVTKDKDYMVAERIAGYFDLSIDNMKPEMLSSEISSYENWKAFNVGVYAPISKPSLSMENKNWFHIHGGAGEVLRSFYPNPPSTTIDVLERKFDRDLSGLRMIIQEFCDSRGLDFNCKSSMPRLYLESRSRIHFGRPSFNHSLHRVFMPLANVNFLKAARVLSHEELVQSKVLFDVLSSTAPELLGFDYDDRGKALKGSIDRSLNKAVSEITFSELEVFRGYGGEELTIEPESDETFESLLSFDLERCKNVADTHELEVIRLSKSDYRQAVQMRNDIHSLFFKRLLYS